MNVSIVAIFCLLLSTFIPKIASATFVREEEIRYDQLKDGPAQIDEATFNSRISQLQNLYSQNVSRFGGTLSIQGQWKNDKLVAQATQMNGKWIIQFSGGLARRPELSADGMTLIICHEIGHHLAGFPFGQGNPLAGNWAANEGAADYFSTHVCAKKVWAQESTKNAEFRELAKAFAKTKCDEVYESIPDRDLCYCTSVGIESIMATMAALKAKPLPNFDTPDATVVDKTNSAHPETQCRMDTTFQGSLCNAYFSELLIPGKKVRQGVNSIEAEQEMADNSCVKSKDFKIGLRPNCWFKPRL